MANPIQKKPQAIGKPASRASAPQKAGIAGFGNGGTPVSGTMGVPRALGQTRGATLSPQRSVPGTPPAARTVTGAAPATITGAAPSPSAPGTPPSSGIVTGNPPGVFTGNAPAPSTIYGSVPNAGPFQARLPGGGGSFQARGEIPGTPPIVDSDLQRFPNAGRPDLPLRIPGPESQRFPGNWPDPNRFPNVPTSYSGSWVTAQHLREAVLRDQDLLLVDLTGSVTFDSTPGLHTIPLLSENDRVTAPGKAGAFYIGQGQALIITDFVPFAAVPNVGLPGGLISIDPLSLLGQVVFSIVSQEGGHPFNQQSSTPTSTGSGSSLLFRSIRDGFPVITSTVKTGNISAAYTVINPPFPGFPYVVGVNVKGYLVDAVLLNQIQNLEVDMPMPVLG